MNVLFNLEKKIKLCILNIKLKNIGLKIKNTKEEPSG